MTDYILGGGLAGMIWGACHPGSIVVEKGALGGMVNNNLGPMMIHWTPYTEEFVESLGMDVKLKEVMVGYTYGLDSPRTVQPPGFKEEYIAHSRKVPISEVAQNGHKSMMNSSKKSFLAIELNMQDFVNMMHAKILEDGGGIMKAEVTNITHRSTSIFTTTKRCFENKLEYDSLVSTLPMYVMKRLIYRGWDSESNTCFPQWSEMKDYIMHKVFVSIKGPDANYIRDRFRGLDFIYTVPREKSATGNFLTRIIPYAGDNPVLEFTMPIDEEDYLMFLGTLEDELRFRKIDFTVTELKNSMIRKNIGLKECRGVKMVGRYAQWDHDIRLHNVIAEAMA